MKKDQSLVSALRRQFSVASVRIRIGFDAPGEVSKRLQCRSSIRVPIAIQLTIVCHPSPFQSSQDRSLDPAAFE